MQTEIFKKPSQILFSVSAVRESADSVVLSFNFLLHQKRESVRCVGGHVDCDHPAPRACVLQRYDQSSNTTYSAEREWEKFFLMAVQHRPQFTKRVRLLMLCYYCYGSQCNSAWSVVLIPTTSVETVWEVQEIRYKQHQSRSMPTSWLLKMINKILNTVVCKVF